MYGRELPKKFWKRSIGYSEKLRCSWVMKVCPKLWTSSNLGLMWAVVLMYRYTQGISTEIKVICLPIKYVTRITKICQRSDSLVLELPAYRRTHYRDSSFLNPTAETIFQQWSFSQCSTFLALQSNVHWHYIVFSPFSTNNPSCPASQKTFHESGWLYKKKKLYGICVSAADVNVSGFNNFFLLCWMFYSVCFSIFAPSQQQRLWNKTEELTLPANGIYLASTTKLKYCLHFNETTVSAA